MKLVLNNFVKNGMSFGRSIASREWNVYAERAWQNYCRGENQKLKMKITNRQQKSIHVQLLRESEEKINLFMLLLDISQERFRGLQNYFFTTVEQLKQRFFLHNTNRPQCHQEGFKYPLLLSFQYLRRNQ